MAQEITTKKGERFGRLVIIKETEPKIFKTRKERQVLCRCDCGNTKTVSLYQLRTGRIISCGCYRKECASYTGKSCLKYNKETTRTRLYGIWQGMKCRCATKTSGSYERYGAKGVSVCDEWKKDFTSFYNWALSNGYSDELTIDRIDYDGDYEPSNCRWADWIVQGNNRSSNVNVIYAGETHTVSEWSRILSIRMGTIYSRRKKGWSFEKIFSTPVRSYVNNK